MRFIGLIALCASAVAQDFDGDILNQLHTVEKLSAEQPATIRIDALMRAASLAKGTHPEAAARLADRAIADIQWSHMIPSPTFISSLHILRPHSDESIALSVGDRGVAYTSLALEKMRTRDGPGGAELIRRALKDGDPAPFAAMPLLQQLARSNPKLALALMQDIVNAFPWQTATAGQLRWMLNCANSIIPADKKVTAATAGRVLQSLKAEPPFRTGVKMCAAYAIRGRFVRTANTRDTLLFPVGVYLRAYGPSEFEQKKELFAKWSDVLDDLTSNCPDCVAPSATLRLRRALLKRGFEKARSIHYVRGMIETLKLHGSTRWTRNRLAEAKASYLWALEISLDSGERLNASFRT